MVMMASEVMAQIAEIIAHHGDLPVLFQDYGNATPHMSVGVVSVTLAVAEVGDFPEDSPWGEGEPFICVSW